MTHIPSSSLLQPNADLVSENSVCNSAIGVSLGKRLLFTKGGTGGGLQTDIIPTASTFTDSAANSNSEIIWYELRGDSYAPLVRTSIHNAFTQ